MSTTSEAVVRDKVAFEDDAGGYHFTVTYLNEPKGEALVEITKDGNPVKAFRWPTYKIWNIAAHAYDIAEELDRESDDGLRVAGSTGLGGNVWPATEETE